MVMLGEVGILAQEPLRRKHLARPSTDLAAMVALLLTCATSPTLPPPEVHRAATRAADRETLHAENLTSHIRVSDIPAEPAAEGGAKWKSWVPTTYRRDDAGRYHNPFSETTLDYGKLFSYLGKLRTAEGIYRDQYQETEQERNARFRNDAEALSERDIDREMLRDRHRRVGMGFLDYADPEIRQKYDLYRLLLHKDMAMMRQNLVAT